MILFLTKEEIATTTIVGANVEIDKYVNLIKIVQENILEPLLGTLLFDKIVFDLENDTLTGDYLYLFTEFIKPITVYNSVAEYIEVSNYSLDNKGLMSPNSQNAVTGTVKDREFLAGKYRGYAQSKVLRFQKWVFQNDIIEYQNHQDEVNPTDSNNSFPLIFD